MPPITKTGEDKIKESIEEALKKNNEMLFDKLNTKPESKVSRILKRSKEGESSVNQEDEESVKKLEEIKTKERQAFDKEKENLQKQLEDSGVFCPTCSGVGSKHEHKHVLKKTDKGTLKCEGDNCGIEYSLVPNNSKYMCENCGTPHSRPGNKEEESNDSCSFCGGNIFVKPEIDYAKIRERINKRTKK